MFTSIKTSESNRILVSELTHKLGLGPENIVARIALAYSLSKNIKYDLSNIKDSRGKEYSKAVLFGQYSDFYIGLISQFYGIYKTDKDIPKYIKIHIDEGLLLLNRDFQSKKNLSGFDFLIQLIDNGLKIN